MTVTDRLGGARSSLGYKAPCLVATTANITLSGEQTIDGVAVTVGDRVLVKDQTSAAENGIYEVRTASWVRAADFSSSRDVTQGTRMNVVQGSVGQGEYEVTTAGDIVLDTTNLTIEYWSLNTASWTSIAVSGQVSAGSIEIGTEDTTAGLLEVFGGPTFGGTVLIYQGDSEDELDAGDYFDLSCDGGNFLIRDAAGNAGIRVNGNLNIDIPNGNLDVTGAIAASGTITATGGTMVVGVEDTTAAVFTLNGGATFGGTLTIWQGLSEQGGSAGRYFTVACDGEQLLIRDEFNAVAMRINGDKSIDFPNGEVGLGKAFTVAGLAALTPTAGDMAKVSDGDGGLAWGDTVVNSGAGATRYLCWYNGANWTVVGK